MFLCIRSKKGFTFVEAVTVLAILGVVAYAFQQFFFASWSATEDRLARAELWQEANDIIETITLDSRRAVNIVESTDSFGVRKIDLIDRDGAIYMTYRVTPAGEFETSNPSGALKVLSKNMDVTETNLDATTDASLRVQLSLFKNVFNRTARIQTTTEVYPRN